MKRIVFFIGAMRGGGAERVVSIITAQLAELGYYVELLIYYDREIIYDIHPNVKVTIVEKENKTKNKLKNTIWIRRYFKYNADIIISFLAPFNIMAVTSHIGLKSKIIVSDRNDPRYVPENWFLRKFRNFTYRFADVVIVQTKDNCNYFSKEIQKKCAIIYNAVDIKEKRGSALLKPKKNMIVSVGRLVPQKNQQLIIEALSSIKNELRDYSITFYGEGKERESLVALAQRNGISDRVFFPGNSDSVLDDITEAKLFVLSSKYEGMPNALIEAMCLGLPVISTKVSGANDLIRNGENGILLENNKPQTMANAIKKVLYDPILQESLAKNATQLNDILDVKIIIRQWIELIKKIER